ncbi:hypothetical protein ACFL5Z_03660 [Planctomycetota bacterium]
MKRTGIGRRGTQRWHIRKLLKADFEFNQTVLLKMFLLKRMCSLLIPFIVLASLTEQAYGDLGWSSMDIGASVGRTEIIDGTFTVVVDGADISDVSDSFHYVYQALSGDGQVIARVTDLGTGSNAWCKAGVMIRETLTPESEHAMTIVTGGEGGGAAFQWRPNTGDASYSSHFPADSVSVPYWVKIVRAGDHFSGYLLLDGTTWTQQGTTKTIPMGTNVYAGLCATSCAHGELRTFTFDNVEYQGTGHGEETVLFEDMFPWPDLDSAKWPIVDGAALAYADEYNLDYFILMNGHPFGGDTIESMAIDLSSFSGAVLSYEYKRRAANWEDDLIISYWDGSAWIEVDRQSGRQTEMDAYQRITIHLPIEALHSDFRFQVRSIGSANDDSLHEDWHIDNLEVMGWMVSTVILGDTWPEIHEDPVKWTTFGTDVCNKGENEPSPPYSLHLNMRDAIRSLKIDLSSYSHAVLTYYFQRAGQGESPDLNDDLFCMYWNGSSYRELWRHPGDGLDMIKYEKMTVTLPPEAMHRVFRLYFESTSDMLFCTKREYDDWFIDDIELRVWR